MSLSARRAWIEMPGTGRPCTVRPSLSARRAWIEIDEILSPLFDKYWSLSARRAWIEIELSTDEALEVVVALRKESVDRNMGAS